MKDNSNEEGIRALAEALRSGGTLLSAACPVCNTPLIKIKEQIFCKVCNKEVIIYKDEKELPKDVQKILKKNLVQDSSKRSSLQLTLEKKLESLRKKIEETDDPDEIIKLTEAIDKLHNLITKFQIED